MMSVSEDKVFEDQIERMKLKNQKILERFQASEEDRRLAESSGSTINRTQNVQIRLRNDDQTRTRKKSNPPPQRPKSYHDGTNNNEISQDYYKFNESRKQGKYQKSTKMIDDEVAVQDYFHFQRTHRTNGDRNYQNRSSFYQNNAPSYSEENGVYKQPYRDLQRSASQKNKSPRFQSNNYQSTKATKVNEQSTYKLDNSKTPVKDSHPRTNNNNAHPPNKSKTKANKSNNQNVDPAGDKKTNNKQKKAILDDEYIDDTLEDLEKYRLKVDMEDFIVIDPESPNPILAMPLTPWTNDHILTDTIADLKHSDSPSELLNGVNERAKDYLNLTNQDNIDGLATLDLSKTDEAAAPNTEGDSDNVEGEGSTVVVTPSVEHVSGM